MKKLILGCLLAIPSIAIAIPITITSQLTGDVRQASGLNPANLIVDVTITSDTTSNVASWTVDLNSPTHPDIKLDEFYFNLTGLATDYSFSNFNPTDWSVISPGSGNGGGFGNAEFLFEATPDTGNSTNITNSQSLTFDMTLVSGLFTDSIFLNAPTITGDAGTGQLGAHLQSLTDTGSANCPNGCNTDSGFAIGTYTGGGTPPTAIPAPATLALMGLGLLGLGIFRRRKAA